MVLERGSVSKMIKIVAWGLVFIYSFSFFAAVAFADMIYLKNKNSMEGIIEKEGNDTIILNVGYGRITLDKRDIQSIYKYSSQEQAALEERWSYQYFTRPEFIPDSLKYIAQDFNNLESARDTAIASKKEKDKAQQEIQELETELAKSKADLAQVNTKLTQLKPEDNLKEYNLLVEKTNSLLAQINLNEYNKTQLQKQITALDKNISGYINEVRLFRDRFSQIDDALTPEAKEEGKYFFSGVEKKIDEMSNDFIKHDITYNRSGLSIIVEAWLNNLVKVNLIVDTGASLVILSQEIIDKLGLDLKDEGSPMLVTLADGRKVKAKSVILKSVKVGEAEVKNVQAAVLEDKEVTDEDGLLGMSFLENFLVNIDVKANRLVLQNFNPS